MLRRDGKLLKRQSRLKKTSNFSLITDLGLLEHDKTKTKANYLKGTNL